MNDKDDMGLCGCLSKSSSKPEEKKFEQKVKVNRASDEKGSSDLSATAKMNFNPHTESGERKSYRAGGRDNVDNEDAMLINLNEDHERHKALGTEQHINAEAIMEFTPPRHDKPDALKTKLKDMLMNCNTYEFNF